MPILEAPNVRNGAQYCSTAYEETATPNVTSNSGMLHSVLVTNKNASTVYVWIFDGADSNGAVLIPPFAVTSNNTEGIDFRYGVFFAKGIYIALSSSIASFSALGANSGWFQLGWGRAT